MRYELTTRIEAVARRLAGGNYIPADGGPQPSRLHRIANWCGYESEELAARLHALAMLAESDADGEAFEARLRDIEHRRPFSVWMG